MQILIILLSKFWIICHAKEAIELYFTFLKKEKKEKIYKNI